MVSALSICLGPVMAQMDSEDEEEAIFELSPFTVEGSGQDGYRATHTLAGTRIKTELKDVGAAISVVTEQFMQDIGATDNETLLSYTLNTEVGGGRGTYGGYGNGAYLDESGTFANPNSNTRVRGLTSADNTRNYFITDIPWDGYIVDRVDMVRGPNAVLFGLGSPAGVVNAGIAEANFNNSGNVELNFGSWGSTRLSAKINRVLIEDELAVKVAMLRDNEKFRQDPAYDNDERLFVAAKYAPSFLQGESSSFTLQGHFESGEIRSNRPRWLPPTDLVTPFFNPSRDEEGNLNPLGGMDRALIHPWLVGDVEGEYDFGIPHLGRNSETRTARDADGNPIEDSNGNTVLEPNPYWTPMIANFGNVFGHPVMVFGDGNSPSVNRVFQMNVNTRYSINEDGVVDTSTGVSYPYNTLHGVNSYDGYARDVELPFFETGAYKSKSLADTSVFDFKNHLIDGPNKSEESDFDTLYLSLSHTFMDGRFGYDLSYFNQNRHQFQTSSVGNAIRLDVNSHLQDLSVNPNAGRPYVESVYDWGTSFQEQKRDAARLTAFARHDFQSDGQDGWLPRLLGRHTVTGLLSEENAETDSRSYVPYVLGGAYRAYQNPEDVERNNPSLRTVHYLGDRIDMRDSAAGANIPALKAVQMPPSQTSVYTFDSHWNAPGVDPAAAWTNPWTGDDSSQAFNPDNYVGWVNMPMDVMDVMSSGTVDDWTTSASRSRSEVKSEALIWQGHFWDGSVVGTYGWRKDTPTKWTVDAARTYREKAPGSFSEDGFRNLSPDTIYYGEPNSEGEYPQVSRGYVLPSNGIETPGQTQTASLAVHLNPLIGDRLPFNVSLYYNTSENFQPLAGRVDLYGNAIPSPSGNTEDYSVLIATKDNKYSLKVTEYKTELQDSNLTAGIATWKITYFTNLGTEWAKRAYYNLSGSIWDEEYTKEDIPDLEPWNAWQEGGWNYYGPYVDNVDQGPMIEEAAIASWFDMLDNLPEGYAEAWSLENYELALTKPSSVQPAGLAFTENSVSKGTEFEFVAQPSDQLRLTFNARKSEASRSNVGGDALNDFVAFLDSWILEDYDADGNRIYNAGDVRRYWLADGDSMRNDYLSFRYDYGLTKLLEGQSNPEFAKWNFNAVATYSFKDGFLGGWYVGGGYRWTDEKVIGYSLNYVDVDGQQTAVTDLDNPYYADAEDAVDVWFGRSMKLNDKVDWRIQVNVRDLFQDGDLIPLTVQPDGTPGVSRIPGSTEWTVSNSFSF
ncbi:TonB-dependent receptor plug domain-containing protein [Pelagicoccus sp. SDUM812003]|uniref:TonB-dependent receptor plug domain-containing protein n=1 Tax=Pelagicoccus sp. SDUM812003 TaxID=3041267 RepID=UPI00280F52EB|nr:TonB-dependent receptor plug domain-containing protein [Pelagicoccus sp. SDUM812003]MDQ8202192.1 hypothetical protein [Pelagicoccus sp. SDUM812003]